MLLSITAVFLLIYAGLIFYYFYHWLHLKEFTTETQASVFMSVVVAARNEEEKLPLLLKALEKQSYPRNLFEVVIVNDYSTDKTIEAIQPFLNGRTKMIEPLVAPHQSSKKKAIEAGVHSAKGDLIVVTDADCIPGENWLKTIAAFHQRTGAAFVAAPVKLTSSASLLSIFQSLDFITLQGITAASVGAKFHSMCNGANLAYTKTAFEKVNGFEGIDKLASGDDMLLMYKIWKQQPGKIFYLKSKGAIVETSPMLTWKDFIKQRIRWSSKATYYKDYRIMLVLLFVYLLNCLFVVLITASLKDSYYWWVLLFYILGKTLIELPFLFSIARFYKEEGKMLFFPLLQPLHCIYTVVIGSISQFGKYEWKGRQTK